MPLDFRKLFYKIVTMENETMLRMKQNVKINKDNVSLQLYDKRGGPSRYFSKLPRSKYARIAT